MGRCLRIETMSRGSKEKKKSVWGSKVGAYLSKGSPANELDILKLVVSETKSSKADELCFLFSQFAEHCFPFVGVQVLLSHFFFQESASKR